MYRVANLSHPVRYKVGKEEGRWLGRVYLSLHTRGKLREHGRSVRVA